MSTTYAIIIFNKNNFTESRHSSVLRWCDDRAQAEVLSGVYSEDRLLYISVMFTTKQQKLQCCHSDHTSLSLYSSS